jgi:UDPglucose--hexose-1-phosphate uridylyltransferase
VAVPELRLNMMTNEWVIIAPERARRPTDLPVPPAPLPQLAPGCPFCPGHEADSGPELWRTPAAAQGPWQTRVVPNKYPAVALDGAAPQTRVDNLRVAVDGVGVHEVIIDSPRHDLGPALMSRDAVAALLTTYRARLRTHAADPRLKHVVLFKNHGAGAGTSLTHPHSQLIGLPVVSTQVAGRVGLFSDYLALRGGCLACRLLADELADGARIVHAGPHFVALIPYAALSAFHLWILPRRHAAHFAATTDGELLDLAGVLRTVLRRLHFGLGDPPYNYVIRTSPLGCEGDGYHWYLAIVPRIGQAAGFELGSGIYINPSLPRDSAAWLRAVVDPEEAAAAPPAGG